MTRPGFNHDSVEESTSHDTTDDIPILLMSVTGFFAIYRECCTNDGIQGFQRDGAQSKIYMHSYSK